jgi:hypothetical protein
LGKAATKQTNLAAHKTKPPPHRLAFDNEQKTTLAQDSSSEDDCRNLIVPIPFTAAAVSPRQ